MRTLVASDLHLGSQLQGDVLRRPEIREGFLAHLDGIDRLVLLGDVLELRELPLSLVLADAYPFFEELGEALGGREVVIVPGNHDHMLAAPLLERRRVRANPSPLGLEQRVKAGSTGPLGAIAKRMPRSQVVLAYPGLRLRDDVYATHGHYLDCHMAVPRAEVLAIGAIARLVGGLPREGAVPDDYEKVLAPLYAFSFQLAQSADPRRRAPGSNLSSKLWARLNARRPTLGARALGAVGIPAIVAALNRGGLGPYSANLSGAALRSAGLLAMAEAAERLRVDADYLIFGHTHRPGPLPGDEGWAPAGGPSLVNTGSWVYEPSLLGSGPGSPYWPGTCVVVDDEGPPRPARLLTGLAHDDLRASVG